MKRAPEVGELATLYVGSDRYPFTVVEVSPTGHQIKLQARRARGQLSCEDPQGRTVIATRRRDGSYKERGSKHIHVGLGRAELYLDPSF